jgi:hypothetical protein
MSGRIPYHRDINIVIEEKLNLLSSSVTQIRLEELPLKKEIQILYHISLLSAPGLLYIWSSLYNMKYGS